MERSLITYPTWERYTVMAHIIFSLSIKDRRHIFTLVRSPPNTADLFFPKFGFTLGDFAVWYTIGDVRGKTKASA